MSQQELNYNAVHYNLRLSISILAITTASCVALLLVYFYYTYTPRPLVYSWKNGEDKLIARLRYTTNNGQFAVYILTKNDDIIGQLTIDSFSAFINGEQCHMSSTSVTYDDRTWTAGA